MQAAVKQRLMPPAHWDWHTPVPLSQGWKAGDFVYVGGQVSADEHGNPVGVGDIEVQTRNVFENITKVLREAGADWTDVIKLNTYYVCNETGPAAREYWERMTRIRLEFLPDPGPAATAVRVAGLMYDELLIEADVVAYVGARQTGSGNGDKGRARVMNRTATDSTPDTTPALGAHVLERPGMRIVDLSMTIYEGMPIFPAHQRPFVMVNQTHDGWRKRYGTKAGFEAHNWLMSEHTGTHTDAILEYVEGGASVEKMPLEYFYGEAVCLDVSAIRHPEWLTPEVLEQAVERSGQDIRPGDIVLLYTGHGERTLPSDAYLTDQTGLTYDGAVWLAERGVVNIGIDAVAIDHSDDGEFSGHMVCAKYRISNTENLVNLGRLVNQRFIYFGLPIPFQAGTGSPVRAIAWLTDGGTS